MIKFPSTWENFLGGVELDALFTVVEKEYETKIIFPPREKIFRALELVSPDDVKVVIIGQDPYHGEGQACGLAFSVADGVKFPPSLSNIFKEVKSDVGTPVPLSGDLGRWAEQGVLLLNTTLTVEKGKPTSHKKMGWQRLTQQIIDTLAVKKSGIVYILWGSHAHKIGAKIDSTKNLVIKEVHPSPLSSYRGFFGSSPFSATNNYLISNNKEQIQW